MQLFQLLQTLDPDLAPKRCKIPLACWNGLDDALDVSLANQLGEWQAIQTKRYFGRESVVSPIAMPRPRLCIFFRARHPRPQVVCTTEPLCARLPTCSTPYSDDILLTYSMRGGLPPCVS